ncbi:MAG: hypothetical protein Q9217_005498 [Psora testacea]
MSMSDGNKRAGGPTFEEPLPKRNKALLEDDSSEDDSALPEIGGVAVASSAVANGVGVLEVNEEFARRFEHNKKREELHKCGCAYNVKGQSLIQTVQEKYGYTSTSTSPNRVLAAVNGENEGSESSSDSEEEDDEGVLASETLDAQIEQTLEAIRKKDPRVYDKNVTFYSGLDEEAIASTTPQPKESKPMYLSDYHRRNLLEGGANEESVVGVPSTYAKQQEDLKKEVIKEMHAAAKNETNGEASVDDGEGDDFLVAKPPANGDVDTQSLPKRKMKKLDIENADRDPETYLSNFVSARAWLPTEDTRFQPFESDDDEEDRKADEFEEAYNLRFEDPAKANEKLMSHARDAAAKYSVRKDSPNPRKRAREVERAKKEAAKQIQGEEKARLRKLKVAEADEKIQKVKEAAGLHWDTFDEQDWLAFLEEGWDDTRWEEEMKKRFGEDYYANHEFDAEKKGAAKKFKKPKWDDEIEIDDLVPEFEEEDAKRPRFELSDGSDHEGGVLVEKIGAIPIKKDRKREQDQRKKEARQERRKIERLVDEQMNVDETLSNFGNKHAGQFRYRETSPLAFGLTAQDILMASDSQLNQYAGLKKMAAFRDSDKKRKDKKRLGKKARLRQWRKDTFGDERGPKQSLAEVLAGQESAVHGLFSKDRARDAVDIKEGQSKKGRVKRAKQPVR